MVGVPKFMLDDTLASDAPLKVWAHPDLHRTYCIGADVAEGLEHGDYSCAQVLDAVTGSQVACWWGRVPADVFAEQLDAIGAYYNHAILGVEQNNHGLTTITRLRQLEYPHLYRHHTVDQVSKKVTVKFGWPTNKLTKPLMIDDLDRAMRLGEVTIYDQHTIGELKTYVRDEHAKMHGSPYDDRVMALAIAVQMIPYAIHSHEEQSPGAPRWSGEWWERQISEQARLAGQPQPLGFHNRRSAT